MPKSSVHLLSYLGGIFDGEGCVNIHRSGQNGKRVPGYSARLVVGMVGALIPTLFHSTFGGQLYTRKQVSAKGRRITCWEIGGVDNLSVFRTLLSYTFIKKAQLEVAIHMLEVIAERRYKPRTRLTDEEIALREADYILGRQLK